MVVSPKIVFEGDKRRAQTLVNVAHQFYNYHTSIARIGEIPFLSRTKLLEDGSYIKFHSIYNPYTDTYNGYIYIFGYPSEKILKVAIPFDYTAVAEYNGGNFRNYFELASAKFDKDNVFINTSSPENTNRLGEYASSGWNYDTSKQSIIWWRWDDQLDTSFISYQKLDRVSIADKYIWDAIVKDNILYVIYGTRSNDKGYFNNNDPAALLMLFSFGFNIGYFDLSKVSPSLIPLLDVSASGTTLSTTRYELLDNDTYNTINTNYSIPNNTYDGLPPAFSRDGSFCKCGLAYVQSGLGNGNSKIITTTIVSFNIVQEESGSTISSKKLTINNFAVNQDGPSDIAYITPQSLVNFIPTSAGVQTTKYTTSPPAAIDNPIIATETPFYTKGYGKITWPGTTTNAFFTEDNYTSVLNTSFQALPDYNRSLPSTGGPPNGTLTRISNLSIPTLTWGSDAYSSFDTRYSDAHWRPSVRLGHATYINLDDTPPDALWVDVLTWDKVVATYNGSGDKISETPSTVSHDMYIVRSSEFFWYDNEFGGGTDTKIPATDRAIIGFAPDLVNSSNILDITVRPRVGGSLSNTESGSKGLATISTEYGVLPSTSGSTPTWLRTNSTTYNTILADFQTRVPVGYISNGTRTSTYIDSIGYELWIGNINFGILDYLWYDTTQITYSSITNTLNAFRFDNSADSGVTTYNYSEKYGNIGSLHIPTHSCSKVEKSWVDLTHDGITFDLYGTYDIKRDFYYRGKKIYTTNYSINSNTVYPGDYNTTVVSGITPLNQDHILFLLDSDLLTQVFTTSGWLPVTLPNSIQFLTSTGQLILALELTATTDPMTGEVLTTKITDFSEYTSSFYPAIYPKIKEVI